ncbi:hypothetical protein M422DRAFT_265910 [Sphaerobolus stellatus SS14]|uniref:Uncharacterized protein n=1 Tax=Sphaerobolus stellatus (strain SS14) TaxID=990650 RepID=A0A0C9USQ1_SPHS4|nr:hypothetical protein M422DRAFT_265910 [Sphaerobolus stellatus SS14]
MRSHDTNRLSCLRLTERCANILYSVRLEIDNAGPSVSETLRQPVENLTEAFRSIEQFIHKQVSRPFLKRYLRRDEDARKIISCDASLTDAVSLFSVAIQVRKLKDIQDLGIGQHDREGDMQLVKSNLSPGVRAIMDALEKDRYQGKGKGKDTDLPPGVDSRDVLAAITAIRTVQAAQDSMLDAADLYSAMRTALRSGDDFVMLEMLQIDRNEMQEAIKTLERALEDPRITTNPTLEDPRITTNPTPLTNRQKALPEVPALPPPSITRSAAISSAGGSTAEATTLYQLSLNTIRPPALPPQSRSINPA